MNEHQPTKRGEPESTRPNIVLIVTDQHRRDHLGRLDERFVTPHLDRLAEKAMVFERAVVANPICMPNRATLATGRMPSVHGTRFNGLPLDDRATTFMQSLADAGYRTGLIGKLHLQNMGDHPEIAAAVVDRTLRNDAVSMPPTGWDSWELKTRYDDPNGEHDIVPGWYGFEHAELAIDHGDVVGGHYALWLRDQGVD
ncbi:MAG: sulfatase-like hydrolase/transferase, partial [Acidimicrobiales bacterium]|nr:sulfatase-like hydrolase/transferase [Acidimicrobiales bacterium]